MRLRTCIISVIFVLLNASTTADLKPSKIVHKKPIKVTEKAKVVTKKADLVPEKPKNVHLEKRFEITAYIWTGKRTASGTWPKAYYSAAGPKSLPIGTVIYIPSLKHTPSRGRWRIEDRGGHITEGRLDLFFPNKRAAVIYGRKKDVKVIILRGDIK